MTANPQSFRTRLLIGASIGAMLLTGVAQAQDRSGGGRVFGGRGGGDPTAAAARAAQEQATRANETNSATQRAIQAFRRAAETRQAMNDAQIAARNAARHVQSTVPNGLGQGGLQVANGVELDPSLWVGANGPVQSQGENGRTNVAIDQTQQRAILTWDSFNVGRETDLVFNQGGADWVALNRVIGDSTDPSQILGSIKADGSVYIINQNGIIFGGASQINVRNLVASTANITDPQFLERGIYSEQTGANYVPSFSNAGGAVTVEAGAQITTNTPESVTSGGGYVLLMGTEVRNEGTITTPRGQTALSAGDDFIIRRGYGTEENTSSTTRGNEVRGLIDEGSTSGTVVNAGLIEAAQGDITLAGRTIRQDGVMVSTTGVHQRGTIHLLNSASDSEGSVTLGEDSLTIILPELDSEDTALNGQREALLAESTLANSNRQTTTTGGFDDRSLLDDRLDQSRIEIVTGGDVLFEGGSQTSAQGGQVAVQANNGRITVEDDARIDVSGVMGVALDMEDNSIRVNIQGNELRDSPANRDEDYLKSQDVWVDVRDLILLPDGTGGYEGDRWYTPGGLLEVGGYLANMEHGIGEWAAVGGTITLAASEVVAEQGAVFDLSGGSLDYRSGYVRSTRVMGADGRMYDIRNAPAHMKMVAVGNAFIRRHDRWGDMYMEVYSDPLFSRGNSMRWEEGYTVGRDAGRLILSAPSVVMNADILSEVINGERQTNARPDDVIDGYRLGQHTVARGASLILGDYRNRFIGEGTWGTIFNAVADTVTIGHGDGEGAHEQPVEAGHIVLDGDWLSRAELGELRIAAREQITAHADIAVTSGGAIQFYGPQVKIGGDLTARAGSINLGNVASTALLQGGEWVIQDRAQTIPAGITPQVDISEGVTLDVRGLTSDFASGDRSLSGLAYLDGGNVSIRTTGGISHNEGAVIDASSGAARLVDGSFVGGRGGDVTLETGFGGGSFGGGAGDLILDGTVRSVGVEGGGTLRLAAASSVVIGDEILPDGVLRAGEEAPIGLRLAEDLVLGLGEVAPFDFTYQSDMLMPGEAATGTVFLRATAADPIITQADWYLADGSYGSTIAFRVTLGGVTYRAGDTIPAGTPLTNRGAITSIANAGFIVPADVFPDGLPVENYSRGVAAGTAITQRMLDAAGGQIVGHAGTFIPAGMTVPRDIAVASTIAIDPVLFSSGFSNYSINSSGGVLVNGGADVSVTMPVYRPLPGRDKGIMLEEWLPPVAYVDPASSNVVRRGGASLALTAQGVPGTSAANAVMADVIVADAASISVDPGQAISLQGANVRVEGRLTAQGGRIDIAGNAGTRLQQRPATWDQLAVEVGHNAVLDVSGLAFSETDRDGRLRGFVLDGGSIRLGGDIDEATGDISYLVNGSAFAVVHEGARLNASGAQGLLNVARRGDQTVSSHGGSISAVSDSGVILDGTLIAESGGGGSSGGRLAIALGVPIYGLTGIGALDPEFFNVRDLRIGGDAPYADTDRFSFATAHISPANIETGGFSRLSLLSEGVMTFAGETSLEMAQSIHLYSPVLALAEGAPDDAKVTVTAPYVRLAGVGEPPASPTGTGSIVPTLGTAIPASQQDPTGIFSVSAGFLDVRNAVQFGASRTPFSNTRTTTGQRSYDWRGFDSVDLVSSGDIRFLQATGTTPRTDLKTSGDLTLVASQIYPAAGADAVVTAGYSVSGQPRTDRLLSIRQPEGAGIPDLPHSVFGSLELVAPRIEQAGVLRAPMGTLRLGSNYSPVTEQITFRPGSVTSVSAKGLSMPYGGTTDGLSWTYAGEEMSLPQLILGSQLVLSSESVDVRDGALIDLSGGGELTGAGFISGRGGSIDPRLHPLADLNPGFGFSDSGNTVYAILPDYQGSYAPVSPDAGAGDPMIGQTISIPDGVPGLPAGRYTLLPSTFALQPGAFRVELGSEPSALLAGAVALDSGIWSVAARLGIAETGLQDTLARQAIISSAENLRTHAQYDETTHSAFVLADAARNGMPRGAIIEDAKSLSISLVQSGLAEGFALRFDGTLHAEHAEGGFGANVAVGSSPTNSGLEIVADDAAASESFEGVSVRVGDLNRLGENAERLMVNAGMTTILNQPGVLRVSGSGNTVLRSGAVLSAAEVILGGSRPSFGDSSNSLVVERGASINTIGQGDVSLDTRSGYVLEVYNGALIASNGEHDVLYGSAGAGASSAPIDVGGQGASTSHASIYTEGTIAFSTEQDLRIDDSARLGGRHLSLAMRAINIGDDGALAAASAGGVLPAGFAFNQTVLDRLLTGDESVGAPAIEAFTLSAQEGLNFFGDVSLSTLDAQGNSTLDMLILRSPAIFGAGSADSSVSIETGHLVWSGMQGDAPIAVGAAGQGGPGRGSGTLLLSADIIELGYDPKGRPSGIDTDDRLILGFADVTLRANDALLANNSSTLAVYERQAGYSATDGMTYEGGNLRVETPLIAGRDGAVADIRAGGALALTAAGLEPGAAEIEAGLGASYRFGAESILVDTAIALPSGRLELNATGDIDLTDAAQLDLAGRTIAFEDVERHSWGGDVILESREGDIRQSAGSVIDLSAQNNHAGRLTAAALASTAGVVDLQGAILGSASGEHNAGGTMVPYRGGSIELRAQSLGGGALSAQFAALNERLNEGGVSGGRAFQLKQGDLTIGSEVQAGVVNVSLDGGHLTVTGTIDASGAEVGTIRLAARDGLNLAGTAVLDAHGETLRVDSYGKIIDSPNRAIVELSSGDGLLTLASGARIDLRHGTSAAAGSEPGQHDGAMRGTLELNAPRLGGATGGDIAIDASGSLTIEGARSIAVNAVQRYDDAAYGSDPAASGRPYQVIDQAYLDAKHAESTAFIDAALDNASLMDGKLAGLNNAAYRDAFHLRPGVEIVSATADGDMIVSGDLDLSDHRYDSVNPNFQLTSVYGSGEVGALTIRAGGDLDIYGSINDGFAPPPETPDDNGWVLLPGVNAYGQNLIVPRGGVVLKAGTTFPAGQALNYDLPISAFTMLQGTTLPVDATLTQSLTLPASVVLRADVTDHNGVVHAAGTLLIEDLVLQSGSVLGAGFTVMQNTNFAALTWPAGVPLPARRAGTTGASLAAFTLAGDVTLPVGAMIPGEANLILPDGMDEIPLRPETDGRQGANWAVASMLPAGSQSWSMRIVAGADLEAADTRAILPASVHGNLTIADQHLQFANMYEVAAATVAVWAPGNRLGNPAYTEVPENRLNLCRVAGMCLELEAGTYNTEESLIGAPWTLVDPAFLGICAAIPEWCVTIGDPDAVGGEPELVGRVYSGLNFSVLRTGTGDLDLLAGRSLSMESLYGVYTAGVQQVLSTAEADAFDRPRAVPGQSVLNESGVVEYEHIVDGATQSTYHAWYPDLGGNLMIRAGGSLTGSVVTTPKSGSGDNAQRRAGSTANVSNWLWRQGSGDTSGVDPIESAWWINFGTYIRGSDILNRFSGGIYPTEERNATDANPYLVGFTGFGTLGGGDLSIDVAGDAGIMTSGKNFPRGRARGEGIIAVVGSTGRVSTDGDLTLTGGGDLDMRIGGVLNPGHALMEMARTTSALDLAGLVVNLRGRSDITAQAMGGIERIYGGADASNVDWFHRNPFDSTVVDPRPGLVLMPGDSVMSLSTLSDMVLSGVGDPGRTTQQNEQAFAINGAFHRAGETWFTLWTDNSAINLFSAGGDLVPGAQIVEVRNTGPMELNRNYSPDGGRFMMPANLSILAPSGNIYMGGALQGFGHNYDAARRYGIWLAPSATSRFEMLTGGSIYGGEYVVAQTSASRDVLATPFNPAFVGYSEFNASPLANARNVYAPWLVSRNRSLFAFGPPTAGLIRDADAAPTRIYAGGDIIDLRVGELIESAAVGLKWYLGAAPTWMLAGGDIINVGSPVGTTYSLPDTFDFAARYSGPAVGGLFVHSHETDVSRVSAGGSILTSSFHIAGPGQLELSAGESIIMNDVSHVTSHGAALAGDDRPGASVAMMAGMANGVDWEAVRMRYLDPANLADPERPLADQPGMAAKVYTEELGDWLEGRYGFSGSSEDALAYFDALAPEHQRIFLRDIYYAETREGGREYNNPDSGRFGSYLRGREMIATLFPDEDGDGAAIERVGDIIMFGGSGVRTNFGGDIEMMAPGGQIVLGVQGEVPPASAGVITQGAGDIRLFSEQSLLLGLSRILTTFGGDIFAWSEEGDINAGRGAKTTVLYTPPLRTYDNYGNVRLSPQVPSSGAGIGTLNPIAEVPPGDIDLIAPLGTIDAGEAGIRVSGNINLAALQVLNAANIQVQGEAAGIPTAVVVNTGALTAASSASTAVAAQAADLAERSRPQTRTEIPTILNVRFLGFGE
ncbi:filamentous hemagglutinin family protein [Sphingopyxis indica]|uniref:Filamentous hemagglutinin family N-terminal domain-containing protein n=1 Tax=Sphingopyxis indica TaxID=436663 RepID=A0A239LFX2_9SPHN|nr:filamentous hemagglutinin family protein [Sphingopyxis indica]SNT29557.1 filamentous hemagglutinin family N-terminal domain-containing protein [Sphingopyxis indica]